MYQADISYITNVSYRYIGCVPASVLSISVVTEHRLFLMIVRISPLTALMSFGCGMLVTNPAVHVPSLHGPRPNRRCMNPNAGPHSDLYQMSLPITWIWRP